MISATSSPNLIAKRKLEIQKKKKLVFDRYLCIYHSISILYYLQNLS